MLQPTKQKTTFFTYKPVLQLCPLNVISSSVILNFILADTMKFRRLNTAAKKLFRDWKRGFCSVNCRSFI